MDEVSRNIEASSDSTSLQDAGGAQAPYGPHAAREQGRNGGQQPPPAFGKGEGLLEVLDRACREFEGQPAVETDDGVLTYGGLDAAANRVANCLIENGAAPGSIIAVLLGRPADVITTLVGVLRAGCVFVPLDTDTPEDRLRHILAELAPRFYVLDGDSAAVAARVAPQSPERAKALVLGGGAPTTEDAGALSRVGTPLAEYPAARPPVAVDPEEMCYVYYTSGSTGVPKGIAGKLKSLTHFIKWEVETFGVAAGWRVSQFTTHTFDAFLRDVFVPLCVGGVVCVPPDRPALLERDVLVRWIKERRVNLVHCVPSLFRVIASAEQSPERFPELRYVLMAGEVLHVSDVKPWVETYGERVKLVNFYGSTETTMIKFFHVITPADFEQGFIPIGRPMRGTRAVLLDDDLNVCPPGVVGELYLRSPYLSLGYYKNPEQTREIFVPNPFSDDPNDTIYKTGDLARQLRDGNYQFVGRKDNLVKVRGFRVELGDVESQLKRHPRVADAVALAWEHEPGDVQLVAYVLVAEGAEEPSLDELREHLNGRLPDYMLPSAFVLMDAFPHTSTGKVDRRALPAPERTRAGGGRDFVAPRTPVEELLAETWAGLLKFERVGVHDNFFHLGGHSLLATQFVSRVRELFNVELPLRSFFRAPTVAAVAEEVEAALREKHGVGTPPVVPVGRDRELPLSYAQQRLWFFDQIEPDSYTYNMPAAVRHRGPLDVATLERALTEIVRRHEAIRTTVETVDGRPRQVVHPARAVEVPLVDLRGVPEGERLERARELATAEARRPFDLRRDLMFRASVLRLAEEDHVVMFTMHHIASDGWSMGLLLREFTALYEAFGRGEASPLGELAVQYADYAVWQREHLSGEVLGEQLRYWRERLGGGAPVLALPTDRPRPVIQTHAGARYRFRLSAEVSDALRELSRSEGATLYMTLLAAYQALLYRYTGQEDVWVGTPVAGRVRRELEGLIGFFVNTLVLRTQVGGGESFRVLLGRVREVCLGAYAHQDVPFEKLVEELQPERQSSYSPLFQVLFVLNNLPAQGDEFPSIELQGVDVQRGTSKFDLALFVADQPGELVGSFEYNTDLFDASTIEHMAGHFLRLLEAVAADAEERVSALPLLTPAEERQLLVEWNDTEAEYPSDLCAHQLFERQVERDPSAVAVVFERERLTYEALNRRSNRLAHHLRRLGVGPEVPVAVCLERSVDVLVAFLGILKAGGAYVPLDIEFPSERLSFMLEDSRARVLVTKEHFAASLPPHGARPVYLDAHAEEIAGAADSNPQSGATPDNLAYIIYTSGSTGQSKGVLIAHRGLCNLATVQVRSFGARPGRRVLQFFSFSFDASIWDIMMGLMSGATLCIAPRDVRGSVPDLVSLLQEQEVSIMTLPPSLLSTLPAEGLPALSSVIGTGEACSAELVARWSKGQRFFNGYGPTETTIGATFHEFTDSSDEPSIGTPYANMKVYLLDEHLRLVPVGVPGELYIAGVGLARGYLSRPALTAERFLPDPFSSEPGARMYRTGDMGRRLRDGRLLFLGRNDAQVKVRGFRVELGEVEAALSRHPSVAQAAVSASSPEPDSPARLFAYYVASEGAPAPSSEELRTFLRPRLPDYMLPASFTRLDRMPLTPSGKVDRKALPAPDGARPDSAAYSEPRTRAERLLARVWTEVLGVERVGRDDNFFELGGDSIISIQVVARANRAGLRLTTRQLFQHQTVAELAAAAEAEPAVVAEAEQGEVRGEVPLTPIQRWFFSHQTEDLHHFNQSVLLRGRGRLDAGALRVAVEGLVRQHDALRLRFRRDEAGEWRQEVSSWEECAGRAFTTVDLSELSGERARRAIEEAAGQAQRSFDLSAGPLLRVVLFELGGEEASRLLAIGHHLAVDGVSWRVLLDDLRAGYEQALAGGEVALGAKTTSFKRWAEELERYATSEELADEVDYWLGVGEGCAPLPRSGAGGDDSVDSVRTASASLSVDETRGLLQEVPAAYRTQVNDALLAALAETLCGWSGAGRVLVDLEGHGREEQFAGVDVTRTVGWFTSSYPVALERRGEVASTLKWVKESLRGVPGGGIGYGVLRYLGRGEVAEKLRSRRRAQVSFNYLGQFDQALGGEESVLEPGVESKGASRSRRLRRTHELEVNAAVMGGRLHVTWDYSPALHTPAEVEALAEAYAEALRGIVAHCRGGGCGYTPSDFVLAGLGQEELDGLFGGVRGVEDIYPLTPMQEGMLFHSLYEPDTGLSAIQTTFDLEGDFDVEAFRRAWGHALRRHAVLRTRFVWEGVRRPLQVVMREAELPLTVEDWRDLSEGEREERLGLLVRSDRARPFDPAQAPLLRLTAVRAGEGSWRVVSSFSHLLADGWSWPVVMRDVFRGYAAYARGGEPEMEAAPAPYREYIAWLGGRPEGEDEAYWRGRLKGFRAPTQLPFDRPEHYEPGVDEDYAVQRVELDEGLAADLHAFVRRNQQTMNTLIQGVWALLLGRYSGEEDVVFGSVVAGRPAELPGVESMVGNFINTLPVRVQVRPDTQLLPWLRTIQERQVEMQQYEFNSLIQVQGWSEVPRELPLFESIIIFENYPLDTSVQGGGQGTSAIKSVTARERTNYPLSLVVIPSGNVSIRLIYDRRRFDGETVKRMAGHFQTLLSSAINARPERLSRLAILTEEERWLLLHDFNDTARPLPEGVACAHQLFERQADLTPNAPALVERGRTVTYAELDERANKLARYLRGLGVGTETKVGLCAGRGVELVVGLLGILKAGGAYVALDPAYPLERLQWMMEDAGVWTLVTNEEAAERVPAGWAAVVSVDGQREEIEQEEGSRLDGGATGESLAYVIYTSGSTGRPKGVMLRHAGLVNLIEAQRRAFGVGAGGRVLQFASLSFDASLFEIVMALGAGAALYLASKEEMLPGPELLDLMAEQNITNVTFPPSVLAALPEGNLPELRTIVSAGEALTADLVERWAAGRQFFNAYGPTETTIWATLALCEETGRQPSIGRPIDNVQAYVLDEQLEPVPVGGVGELHIAGVGLARGYVNLPGLTSERFVPDPFATRPGERLYKTGDLARYLPDGQLMFLGRIDNQVKVRGFRIEPGEVEAALKQFESVRDAAVAVRENVAGDKVLVGYVVPAEGEEPTEDELRSALKQRLPEYMVPTIFVILESMPLMPSGKIDRRALPAPTAAERRRKKVVVAPRTPTEEKLVEIWAAALQHDPGSVSIHDNFFELGGHSLLVANTIFEIRKAFGVELPMRVIFETGNLSQLAKVIEIARQDGVQAAMAAIVTVDPNDEVELDESIRPEGPAPDLEAEYRSVFLTGATGFVGGYLLRELMEQTRAEVYCLVRCQSAEEGRQRIRRNLEKYEIWDDAFDARVRVVRGNLTVPLLGLPEEQFRSLAADVDAVYHCAAAVSFLDPYYRIKSVNVTGTQEMIRFACKEKTKPLHYVSALSVFVSQGHPEDDDGIFREEMDIERWRHPGGGYAQSKWVAERIVMLARSRGLPVTVYRPGGVAGGSDKGIWNTEDFLCRMMLGCIQLGSVPYANTSIDLTPVDFVSKSIVHLSRRRESFDTIYHLNNPKPSTAMNLVRHISALGYPLRFDWFEEWQRKLFAALQDSGENALSPFLPMFETATVLNEEGGGEEDAAEAAMVDPPQPEGSEDEKPWLLFSCENAQAALAGTAITCPPLDMNLLRTYLSYFVRSGMLKEPRSG